MHQVSAREEWDDELSDVAKAQRKFQVTVLTLTDVLSTIDDSRAKARAQDIIGDLGEHLDNAISAQGPQQERFLGVIDLQLKELESLLAGQRLMFSSMNRIAMRFIAKVDLKDVPHVFKLLRGILDEIAQNLEEVREEKAAAAAAEAARGFKPQFTENKGPKFGPKVPAAPKAKKTYAKAQNEIMLGLDHMGWKLSGALKIPHATAPGGRFRLWFKAQAIYSSDGSRVNDFKSARSTWAGDIRQEGAVESFLAWAKKQH